MDPSSRLGRYRLLSELGRGGMGVVHLAEASGPGGFAKLVVVKELKGELACDPAYRAMFLDEARLAARLSHRHIVQTNEVGCEDGRYFMQLELLEGASLHQIRQKLGLRALPVPLGLRALAAVLEALDHAHRLADADGFALGIVHRDVSPPNVFLTYDGNVKLIDFGVAKSADRQAAAATQVGVVKGSIVYMSPDHVDGCAIDGRADVFAVGVLMRELVTGERLWGAADDLTILRRLIGRDVPPLPPRAAAELPQELLAIVRKALAPRREDRYASADAMLEELEAYLHATDPHGSLDDLGPWLARAFDEERAAFRDDIRKLRGGVPAPAQAQVWLPSSDLATRVTQLPAGTAQAKRTHGRLRPALATAMFAVAVVLAGLGFAHPRVQAELAPLEPRTADIVAPQTLVTTAPSAEAREARSEEPAEIHAALAKPDVPASIPVEMLREALPDNPYDADE